MTEIDTLTKCLGKSLKTEIKFIAIVKTKFFSETLKEIKPGGKRDHKNEILCLGRDNAYILENDMSKIIEIFSYEALRAVELDAKSQDMFYLHVHPGKLATKASKISVKAKFRGSLVKNFLCYFSVYYMQAYSEVRELRVMKPKDPSALAKTNQSQYTAMSKIYTKISTKNYE